VHTDVRNIVSVISAMREQFNHHGPRVAGYAVKLAEVCGMTRNEIGLVAAGAALHDIGKIFIDADLLNAPRKLTTAERNEMKKHVALGWVVVERAGYEQIILDIIRSHHEKWDGTGYPDKLQGQEIPLAARVVTICDVYQAMTAERSYRGPCTHEFTRTYIEHGRGTYFDPRLVDLFFEQVLTERGEKK